MKRSRLLLVLLCVLLFLLFAWFIWFVLQSKPKSPGKIAPYYDNSVFTRNPSLGSPSPAGKAVKLPIIMYHYVEYRKSFGDLIEKRLDINPDIFEKQLITLKQAGYNSYFVKDVPNIIEKKKTVPLKSLVLSFDDGYEDFYSTIFPILKKYNFKATLFVSYNYVGRKGFVTFPQMAEMIASGRVEIGSHTIDHLFLTAVPRSIARTQIFNSKNLLEKKLGVPIKTFAYPYGAFDKTLAKMVQEAGYKAAVSVINGDLQSEENLYYLSRISAQTFIRQNILILL